MTGSACYFNPDTSLFLDISSGVYRYDSNKRVLALVRRMGKQERRVLACLLAHDGRVVTKEMLLAEAWPGRVISHKSINVTISRLRSVLRCIDPQDCCLRTVRNAGFSLFIAHSGAIPIISQDFLLANLRWSEEKQGQLDAATPLTA